MSERETCWLVETKSSTGATLWWASMRGSNARVTADRMKANRYTESIAWAIADALHTSTGDDWRSVEHTFDPPKTPGQRLLDAFAHHFLIYRSLRWDAVLPNMRATWEAAAAEFLAGEPKAESVEAKHAADVLAQLKEYCEKITRITPTPYGPSESVAEAVAREREACAKLVIAESPWAGTDAVLTHNQQVRREFTSVIVNAIRARGNQ